MEWMLQVVDEIDDAINAARHLLNFNAGIARLLSGLGSSIGLRSTSLRNGR